MLSRPWTVRPGLRVLTQGCKIACRNTEMRGVAARQNTRKTFTILEWRGGNGGVEVGVFFFKYFTTPSTTSCPLRCPCSGLYPRLHHSFAPPPISPSRFSPCPCPSLPPVPPSPSPTSHCLRFNPHLTPTYTFSTPSFQPTSSV